MRGALVQYLKFSCAGIPSLNSFRGEPVLCLSGPRAVTSFEGSKIVQNRCYCIIFHLLFKTVYNRIEVREEMPTFCVETFLPFFSTGAGGYQFSSW